MSSRSFAPSSTCTSLTAPSLRRRMACWLYEGLLLFALMMVMVLLQSALAIVLPVLHHPALLQLSTLVLWGAYFTWFWQRGQTLPMKTWRLQVLDTQGQRLSRPRALTRYAFCWLWALPVAVQFTPWHLPLVELAVLQGGWVLVWALLSRLHPQGQFWHDVFAGTRLVQAS